MELEMLIKREFHGMGGPHMEPEHKSDRDALTKLLDDNLGKYAKVTIEILTSHE